MSQQWLPIISETSKIQCRMVISQVLDENQSQFLILTRRKNRTFWPLDETPCNF